MRSGELKVEKMMRVNVQLQNGQWTCIVLIKSKLTFPQNSTSILDCGFSQNKETKEFLFY